MVNHDAFIFLAPPPQQTTALSLHRKHGCTMLDVVLILQSINFLFSGLAHTVFCGCKLYNRYRGAVYNGTDGWLCLCNATTLHNASAWSRHKAPWKGPQGVELNPHKLIYICFSVCCKENCLWTHTDATAQFIRLLITQNPLTTRSH